MRVRQHVNPLKMGFLTRSFAPLALPPAREVELEVGCAEAQFLFERTRLDRSRVGIGLEIRHELVEAVNAEARHTGLDVRAVYANASVDVPRLFAPGTVARAFVNFPDPWFKRRHHKRRVVDGALVLALARALRPGGELFFQSDVWDLALDALSVFEAHDQLLDNRAGTWSFWKDPNPYGARSRREEACEAAGLPVWRLLYQVRLPQGQL
jgi:tRNA (guanine-N7-)-methyltransferase